MGGMMAKRNTTTDRPKDSPRQRYEDARDTLATMVLEDRIESYQRVRGRRRETSESDDADWEEVGSYGTANRPTGQPRYVIRPFARISDRQEARWHPWYQDETDLQYMRAVCRNLGTFSSIWLGAHEALNSYVMGEEWEYKCEVNDGAPEAMGAELVESIRQGVQAILEDFLERNDWLGNLDSDLHDDARIDGESMLALYPVGWRVKARQVEIDALQEPAHTQRLNAWLGIDAPTRWDLGVHYRVDPQMRTYDRAEPLGYHLTYDDIGREWDYLPRWPQPYLDDTRCGTLIKRNVPQRALRGVSDYWTLNTDLEREYKIARNTGDGVANQAAIAYIVQHGIRTAADVQGDLTPNDVLGYRRGPASTQHQPRRYDYCDVLNSGTVVHVSEDEQYHAGPMGELRSPIFMDVAQYLLRRIGVRWNTPEYMISGDASNANFASTLVSGTPFVRRMKRDQKRYGREFKSIMWKVVRMAYLAGFFESLPIRVAWEVIRKAVKIVLEAPEVEMRDPMQATQRRGILFGSGIIDRSQWATMEGLDPNLVQDSPRPTVADELGAESTGTEQSPPVDMKAPSSEEDYFRQAEELVAQYG